MREWIDGPKFSNYVENDTRCLGTVVAPMSGHPGTWDARDNTKLNKSGTAARSLGLFDSLEEAKRAVENATEAFGDKAAEEIG